jgi:hypothetical protein
MNTLHATYVSGFADVTGWPMRLLGLLAALIIVGCQWTGPAHNGLPCDVEGCCDAQVTTETIIESPIEHAGFVGLHPTYWSPWPSDEPSIYAPSSEAMFITPMVEEIPTAEPQPVTHDDSSEVTNDDSSEVSVIVPSSAEWAPTRTSSARLKLRRATDGDRTSSGE